MYIATCSDCWHYVNDLKGFWSFVIELTLYINLTVKKFQKISKRNLPNVWMNECTWLNAYSVIGMQYACAA